MGGDGEWSKLWGNYHDPLLCKECFPREWSFTCTADLAPGVLGARAIWWWIPWFRWQVAGDLLSSQAAGDKAFSLYCSYTILHVGLFITSCALSGLQITQTQKLSSSWGSRSHLDGTLLVLITSVGSWGSLHWVEMVIGSKHEVTTITPYFVRNTFPREWSFTRTVDFAPSVLGARAIWWRIPQFRWQVAGDLLIPGPRGEAFSFTALFYCTSLLYGTFMVSCQLYTGVPPQFLIGYCIPCSWLWLGPAGAKRKLGPFVPSAPKAQHCAVFSLHFIA